MIRITLLRFTFLRFTFLRFTFLRFYAYAFASSSKMGFTRLRSMFLGGVFSPGRAPIL